MPTPSLKINILASYASQIYLVIISIAILPIYMKYMGAEAYGLVGFFAMLQGLFSLLDFGLTPTISRQTAQYNAGVDTALGFRQLFRSLSVIFTGIACIGGGLLFNFNHYIAEHWLKLENLVISDVSFCLQIMAICVALRWMIGLYRGVISGFERIVWLSIINIVIATLRFPGVLLYMYYFGFTVTSFFIFQLIVAIIEFVILAFKAYLLLPKIDENEIIGWSFKPVKPILSFALTIAFTSSVWVLLTQLDKFVLSGILPLSEYGYFTLAVLVAGGILQIGTPISSAIMPRMARLHGEEKQEELKQVYLGTTQFVAVVVVTAGIVLAILSKQVLYVWTGDIILAENAAPILQLYALGNSILTLGAFPYYLQYAKGNLKLHFIGNLVTAIVLIPVIIWAAKNYGAIGAGWAWALVQSIYLVFWVSYVHKVIEPNINIIWFKAFLPSIGSVTIVAFILYYFIGFSKQRDIAFLQICVISVISLIIAILSSEQVRNIVKSKVLQRSR
ncbi:oligosaccharide flippase family protein [Acinetobacter bereziniae]|uniref:oligosaccharide flippase family protein n=1 Tax=Acinetobacter bereziniae TaxID=106648 RepID=UPI0018FF41F6|nr:oligosaccharide flippase family protein [Acinetobacter bereziniae]MBJ8451575.1 oligosaccharide flippase family protein [Acinetobacter bereziniae]MBJ8458019.1 oligosaccharide flippase family protein [Acinetobacter bereziniae]